MIQIRRQILYAAAELTTSATDAVTAAAAVATAAMPSVWVHSTDAVSVYATAVQISDVINTKYLLKFTHPFSWVHLKNHLLKFWADDF